MKVKMLVGMSGPGINRKPEDEVEVSAAEGKRLIEAGIAVEIKTPPAKKPTTRKASSKKASE